VQDLWDNPAAVADFLNLDNSDDRRRAAGLSQQQQQQQQQHTQDHKNYYGFYVRGYNFMML